MKRLITTFLIFALTLSLCFAVEHPKPIAEQHKMLEEQPKTTEQPNRLEQPKTVEELINLAKANDLQTKIDAVTIEKLEIRQAEAHRLAGNISYGGDDDAQIVRVYTIQTVDTKRADNELKYQKIAQQKHNDELVVKVENGVANYVLAERELAVKKAEVSLLERKAEAAKLKVKLGSAIALDLIEAENAVTEAKLNLIDIENNVTDALLELKKIVGTDFVLDIPYEIVITTPYSEAIEENVDTYVARKLDVIKAVDNYDVQQGLTEVITANYRETLREYKQGVLDLTIAENERDDAVKNAEIDIVADYNQLQVHYKNYQVAAALLQIAEKELVNNQTKLKLGVISKLDLAASEQALLERQFDVASAINKYNKAKRNYLLNLKQYDVDITPKEIDLNDIYYLN